MKYDGISFKRSTKKNFHKGQRNLHFQIVEHIARLLKKKKKNMNNVEFTVWR